MLAEPSLVIKGHAVGHSWHSVVVISPHPRQVLIALVVQGTTTRGVIVRVID